MRPQLIELLATRLQDAETLADILFVQSLQSGTLKRIEDDEVTAIMRQLVAEGIAEEVSVAGRPGWRKKRKTNPQGNLFQ